MTATVVYDYFLLSHLVASWHIFNLLGKPKRNGYSIRITAETLNGVREQQVAACLVF